MSEENNATTPEEPKMSKKQQTQDDLITRANIAADRLNAENLRLEQNLQRMTELSVERTLAGSSVAGQEEPPEESPQEYAKRIMSGRA